MQLVAIGALTNVALLIILYPEVCSMIDITIMGGCMGTGEGVGPVLACSGPTKSTTAAMHGDTLLPSYSETARDGRRQHRPGAGVQHPGAMLLARSHQRVSFAPLPVEFCLRQLCPENRTENCALPHADGPRGS